MITAPRASRAPKVETLTLDNWNRGRVSILDDNRGLIDGVDESINVWLTQNGVVEPRPSLKLYGTQPIGEIIGWTEVMMLENGLPVNYIVTIQNIAGTGYVYYNKDGGPWTLAPGITYADVDAEYNFCQVDQKCLIMNGVEKTHYLDFTDRTIKRFELLTKASSLTATAAGLTTGGVVLRYAVTSQSLGETTPVNFPILKVDRERQEWEAGTHSVTLQWTCTDPKVKRFLIYVGAEEGKEQYMTYIANDGSGTFKFTDNGTLFPQPGTTVPLTDTSEGVVGRRATNINGTVYLLGDKNNPYRIYYDGGEPKTALNFSPFGGGWIDIAPGGKDLPTALVSFRTGKGDSVPTVMTQSTNGFGGVKHLVDQVIDVGGAPVTVMAVQDANGREGTDAPNAIITYQESLHYLSKNGSFTTGTQPNVQSILSTTKTSATIAEDFKTLNIKSLGKASGMVYDGRLLWSLAVGTTENSQIWVNDLDRGGAWLLPWLVPAKFLMHYGSNDGDSHQLALVNNQICEFTSEQTTTDIGVPFPTKIKTSKVYFSKKNDFARVLTVDVDLIDPVGEINVIVRGRTSTRDIQKVKTINYPRQQKITGWGDLFNFFSPIYRGWGKAKPANADRTTETETVSLKINKDLKWVSVEISTRGSAYYGVHKARVRHVPIGYLTEKSTNYGQ